MECTYTYIHITLFIIVNAHFLGPHKCKNSSLHSSKLAVTVNSKLCQVCINIHQLTFRLFWSYREQHPHLLQARTWKFPRLWRDRWCCDCCWRWWKFISHSEGAKIKLQHLKNPSYEVLTTEMYHLARNVLGNDA